jgi:hypothetical protein
MVVKLVAGVTHVGLLVKKRDPVEVFNWSGTVTLERQKLRARKGAAPLKLFVIAPKKNWSKLRTFTSCDFPSFCSQDAP